MKFLGTIPLLACVLLLFTVNAQAQLSTDWEYLYDDFDFPYAEARSLDMTSTGDLVVVGNEDHGGNNGFRFLAFRIRLDGSIVSISTSGSISIGTYVEQFTNDDWVLLTNRNNGTIRYFDSNYEFKWLKNYEGSIGEVHSTTNNRIIVPITYLEANSQIYLLSAGGYQYWVYTVPLSQLNLVDDVAVTSDNSIVFPTVEVGGLLYLFKINIMGNLVWNSHIQIDGTIVPQYIDYLIDGGFVVSGYLRNDDQQIGIVKFGNEGQLLFMREGVFGQSLEMGDGSLLNVESTDPDISRMYWYDASGQMIDIFTYEFSNPPVFQQRIADVEVTGDSSFAVCGRCGNELFNQLSAFVTHFTLPPTDVEINIEAYRQPLFIRRQGVFYWYGEVRNNTALPMTRDVWVQVRKPDGSLSGALALWSDLEIPANGEITATVRQGVPQDAPLGGYNYIVRVGDYPNPQFQHHFALTVVDGQPVATDANGVSSTPDFVPDRPLKPSDYSLEIRPETWNVIQNRVR